MGRNADWTLLRRWQLRRVDGRVQVEPRDEARTLTAELAELCFYPRSSREWSSPTLELLQERAEGLFWECCPLAQAGDSDALAVTLLRRVWESTPGGSGYPFWEMEPKDAQFEVALILLKVAELRRVVLSSETLTALKAEPKARLGLRAAVLALVVFAYAVSGEDFAKLVRTGDRAFLERVLALVPAREHKVREHLHDLAVSRLDEAGMDTLTRYVVKLITAARPAWDRFERAMGATTLPAKLLPPPPPVPRDPTPESPGDESPPVPSSPPAPRSIVLEVAKRELVLDDKTVDFANADARWKDIEKLARASLQGERWCRLGSPDRLERAARDRLHDHIERRVPGAWGRLVQVKPQMGIRLRLRADIREAVDPWTSSTPRVGARSLGRRRRTSAPV